MATGYALTSTREEMETYTTKWSSAMEEKLINLWQEHECLYNVNDNSYHNRTDKEKSWAAIATELNQPRKYWFVHYH